MNQLTRFETEAGTSAPGFDPTVRPTQETYDALQRAYDEANYQLFEGALPNSLITLQRRGRTMGYFSPDRFARGDGEKTHELAINPAYFRQCELTDTLSVLVHEMIHVWQQHFGKPGRGRYHNRQFAEKSKSLGLYPSATGESGGAEIGDSMSHYIIEGGQFEMFASQLIAAGFALDWSEKPPQQNNPSIDGEDGTGDAKPDKAGKRIKYTCGACGLNAWAKHEARLVCGEDMTPMAPA